jgi:hypothetical protein
MLEPNGRNWAFALEMPETWSSENRRERIRMSSDYQLAIWPPGTNAGRIVYSVTSHSRYRAMESLTPGDIDLFTRLPPGSNPRTRALVESLLSDSPDAQTIIDRGLDVFRQQGFFYTLTPPALGEHTADEFIFDTREGFCEHYASAFAIMMRMAGLPTRIVTGYQGGELNAIGEYYIVRQTEAHAWTEVWTEADGWVRVDPISAVAPERIAAGSTRTTFQGSTNIASRIGNLQWLRQAALAWDAVNTFWADWVIGYGPRLQRTLLEWLGFDRPRWRELMVLIVAAFVAFSVALAAWLHLKQRRAASRDPAARSFDRFTRRLRQLSVSPIAPGETPSAYAERAGDQLPQHAETIDAITRAYLAARYEPDTGGHSLARLTALVRSFSSGYARA